MAMAMGAMAGSVLAAGAGRLVQTQSSGSRAVKEVTQMSMAKKMYFTVLRGAGRA